MAGSETLRHILDPDKLDPASGQEHAGMTFPDSHSRRVDDEERVLFLVESSTDSGALPIGVAVGFAIGIV